MDELDDEMIEKLKLTDNSIPDFCIDGLCTLCKVVDVYDGDTFRVVFYRNKELIKMKVRGLGYNSPEIHPLHSNLNRNEEIKNAIKAKNRLLQLCGINIDIEKNYSKEDIRKLLQDNTTLLYIEFGNFDKYGRVLATIYDNKEKSINQSLIDEKYAVCYEKNV